MAEPRLAGKRALVTGGSRGIGAATARRLAEEGAEVAVNYVSDAASAEGLVKELRDNNYRAAAFQADISDPAQARSLVDRVVAEFGGLDIASAMPASNTSPPSTKSPSPISTGCSTPTSPASSSPPRPPPRSSPRAAESC